MPARPSRGQRLALALAASLGAAACTPSSPPVSPLKPPPDQLGEAFLRAFEGEQRGEGKAALAAHLALVDQSLSSGEGLRLTLAALDALLWRRTPGLERAAPMHALAFREPGALDEVGGRLSAAFEQSKSPLARAFIAQGLLDIARFKGDPDAAARWRKASGLITRAVAVGPLSPAGLTDLEKPTPLEGALRDSYPGVGPFAAPLKPAVVEADDGVIDAGGAGWQPGLYAVAVDIDVPRAQRVWLAVQTTAGAVLTAGGQRVLQRPYSLGGGATLRMGWIEAPAGKVRLVLRLASNEDGQRLSLMALGDDGAPLAHEAPGPSAPPSAAVTKAGALEITTRPGAHAELTAAALLAAGDGRGARRALEEGPLSPAGALLYARALNASNDTPENRRIERARAAYAQASEGWPDSWEAQIGGALLAASRKGFGEGSIETLRDLARRRGEGKATAPLVRAFEASTAVDVGARDVAKSAFEELKGPFKDTPLLASLDERVYPRVGAEAEAWACAAPQVNRGALSCLQVRQRRGDFAQALAELGRLRQLRGSPRALLPAELSIKVAQNDAASALSLYDALLPAERPLSTLGLLGDSGQLLPRVERDRATSRDAPAALSSLRRRLGPDPVPALEAEGKKAVDDDRKSSENNSAATLVLVHTERYELENDGLLRALFHDVRRVSGTTDVEQGVGSASFSLVGRDMRRLLRRRIHKRDGRTLEPDAAAMASQGNSDLSQLEPGDYIEQIAEAWVFPDRAGHLVVDTPDLLPERTSVKKATIEVKYPKKIALTRWSHPLLGRPEERDEGASRLLRFQLANASPRRIEEGAPRMDRDVALSFGTYSWPDVGRQVGELIAALEDDDPHVARWAKKASSGASGRALVDRVVEMSGKSVRVPQANLLSDVSASLYAGPQLHSARHVLELGQGSRSLVVYRALRSLDVAAEIVVAEREPFSSDPAFPPRPARFDHPLVIAHLPEGDVWIDADLPGPPLPAGRVSPELRGRVALRTTGATVAVQGANAEEARDDVEISLKIDERGDARGTFSIQLHGRTAQAIVDALDRVAGSDRRDLLRGVVLGWMPWATVNEVTLTPSEGSGALSVKAEVTIPSLAQSEGKAWVLPGFEPVHSVLPRPSSSTLGAAYTSRLGRQSALAIDAAVQYRVRRRLELPASWKAPALPSASIKHDLLDASRSGRVSGSTIEEEFSLSLASGTVSADTYERFAAAAKRVDDSFLAAIRVNP